MAEDLEGYECRYFWGIEPEPKELTKEEMMRILRQPLIVEYFDRDGNKVIKIFPHD